MTSDPARHLADVGSRLLKTLRPFFEVPVAPRLPDAYSDVLLDPAETLSGVCDGLLAIETTPAPPEGEEPAPVSTGSLPRPGPRERDTAAPRSRHDVSRAEISGDFPPAPRPETRAPVPWPDVGITNIPPPAGPDSYVRSSGAADLLSNPPALRQEAPVPTDAGSWERSRPARSGFDPRPALGARPPAGSGVCAPGARFFAEPSPAEGYLPAHLDEPIPEDSGAPLPPARRASREDYRPEALSTVAPAAADHAPGDPAGVAPGSSRPGAVRLASGAGRLAAVLRAHAADATPGPGEDRTEPFTWARDGGELRRAPEVGRANVEEVLEGLADELETEFVRAYGSSGV